VPFLNSFTHATHITAKTPVAKYLGTLLRIASEGVEAAPRSPAREREMRSSAVRARKRARSPNCVINRGGGVGWGGRWGRSGFLEV
jgi:hypothetical protein